VPPLVLVLKLLDPNPPPALLPYSLHPNAQQSSLQSSQSQSQSQSQGSGSNDLLGLYLSLLPLLFQSLTLLCSACWPGS